MTTVCQIYHEPTATVLFDLNDAVAANVGDNGYTSTQLLQTVDLGSPQWEFDRFSPRSQSGGYTTFQRAGFRTISLPFRMRASSGDNLAGAMGKLSALITAGCVVRWRNDGGANYRYIGVEPSQNPYYIDGRELSLYLATTLVDTPDGITLLLTCQPFLRGEDLPASGNALVSSTLVRDSNDDGTPDSWVWDSTTGITAQNIDASAEAHEFTVATATARNMQQTSAAATAASGDVWTFSFYARSVSANAEVQAVVRYNSSAPADLGSDFTSSVTTLTTGWQRIAVTTTAAPATTDRVKVSLRVDNGDATSRDVQWKNAKLEKAAAATPFSVGVATVAMDPAATGPAKYLPVYNPGDAPSPVEFVITAPDASTVLERLIMSCRSSGGVVGNRNLTDFLNGPFKAQAESSLDGWTVALGTNVAAAVSSPDGSGSGSDIARINHVTDPTVYSKKITWTRTTDLDALRGEHDVWARVEAQGSEKFFLQLRWGPGNTSLVPYALDEVTHDASEPSAFDYVMVKLGRIRLPLESQVTFGTLKLELWTHTESADQDLDVDYLSFMPAESQATLSASASNVTWLGRELVTPVTNPAGGTAGVDFGDSLKFDTTTDNAGSPPAAGSITTAGMHEVTFRLTNTAVALHQIVIRIRNITDSLTTITATRSMPAGSTADYTLNFTAVAGKVYQAQVDDPTGTNVQYVVSITDGFCECIVQNEKIRTDPGTVPSRSVVEKLDASSTLLGYLDATGVPFWVPPGLSLIGFEALDEPALSYEDPKSVNARTLSVAANVTPMFHGP